MANYWKLKSDASIKKTVFDALKDNVDYDKENSIGLPASYLDQKVFNRDNSFLKDAPYLSTLLQNPNHIGCHTLGHSESYFKGTQKIEIELINICAVDILKAKPDSFDGYVASGGTEANMQAAWVYRNYFMQTKGAKASDIALLCSVDSHYSMNKSCNVLGIDLYRVKVNEQTRKIEKNTLDELLKKIKSEQKKHIIVVCNMMTTMFGSVDDVALYNSCLKEHGLDYKIHVDGAYGGFYYPFSSSNSQLTFNNEAIDSFTLDAHKMAQAPYGTGIFICRKGLIQYANTKEASYLEGEDFTLIGSRSGANAVGAWMILSKHGPFGWREKIFILQKRTEMLCNDLDALGINFYRHPEANIVTIPAHQIPKEIAHQYSLVPDNHKHPKWYKIVVMEHVTSDKLHLFIEKLKNEKH